MKHLITTGGLLMAALLATPASALEVGSLRFDDSTTLDTKQLVANGGGIRTKIFFKVYAMVLYLPAKTTDAAQAISGAGGKRIAITLMRDLKAQQFVDALKDGVEANHTPTELAALKDRLDAFSGMMLKIGEAKEGTSVLIDWLPAAGTRLTVNGTVLGELAGDDFYQALLRVWLGKSPAQDDLKAALLGGAR